MVERTTRSRVSDSKFSDSVDPSPDRVFNRQITDTDTRDL